MMRYCLQLPVFLAALVGAAWVVGQAQATPPECQFVESTHEAAVGEPILFDGGMSFDPDGDPIVSWLWEFGNGEILLNGPVVDYAYPEPGDYLVCLTVTDASGEQSTCCQPKVITPACRPPAPDLLYLHHPGVPGNLMLVQPEFDVAGFNQVLSATDRNDNPPGCVVSTEFSASLDGGMTWLPLGIDYDGWVPTRNHFNQPYQHYGWWEVPIPTEVIPLTLEGIVPIKVTMTDYTGFQVDSFFDVWYDITPPTPEFVSPPPYFEIAGEIVPLECTTWDENVISCIWEYALKPLVYDRGTEGLPGLDQHDYGAGNANDGNEYCGPTAAAACLRWLEAQGYIDLSDHTDTDLVEELADLMDTDPDSGTADEDFIDGLQDFVDSHGGGLNVASIPADGQADASEVDFDDYRDQMEAEGEDVLVAIPGHWMTGKSIDNWPNADGTHGVDFMDPWTGTQLDADMNDDGSYTDENGDSNSPDLIVTVSPTGGGSGGAPATKAALLGPWTAIGTDTDPSDGWSIPWDTTALPPGLYFIRATMTDALGVSLRDWRVVRKLDLPPECSIDWAPDSPFEGQGVAFDSNAADPDGGAVTCTWEFGDGSSDTGCAASHTYADDGTYTVTVTVCDDEGNCTTCTAIIEVQPKLIVFMSEPIDPAWTERRPPLHLDTLLWCFELSGHVTWHAPGGHNDIESVEFDYSLDGGMTWSPIGTDYDGTTETAGGRGGPSEPQYNLWSVVWDTDADLGPTDQGTVRVRATMTTTNGFQADSFFDIWYDITAPDPEVQEPVEYQAFPEGSVIPLRCHTWDEDVVLVSWWWQPKQDYYVKGVPPLDQHDFGGACPNDGNMYCAPTATASCLKWWAANGYPNLNAGVSDQNLVNGLAGLMGTSCYDGTTAAGQVKGAREWIKNHGGGLHVTGPSPVTPRSYRNEIENCKEDVLFWLGVPGEWWHAVTGNSVRNRPDPDGSWEIDYMDPWTAEIVWTHMRPDGQIEDPPGSGTWISTANMITISPDVPRQPWYPSCEVEPPYLPCQPLVTAWDLNDPNEWIDPATPMTPGLYLLRCDIEDASGHLESETIVIEILDAPPTCAITWSPDPGVVGEPVSFDANASDPGGGAVACTWDFGDSTGDTGCAASHTYTSDGIYTVTVTVCDDEGTCTSCSADVTIRALVNQPPQCCFEYAPLNPDDATPVHFGDCSVDPDGDVIVSWFWDFGDGYNSTDMNPTHTFAAGTWNVCLTVTDDGSPPASSTCCQTITVTESACTVICQGAVCGGPGPRMYQYEITVSAGSLFNHWHVGTDDPNIANYSNWVLPPGWVVTGIFGHMVVDNDFTPHGGLSAPTGDCPHTIVFGGPAIASGVFGYDHAGQPHDVGWLVECAGSDCPAPLQCVEDWAKPVGMGQGPVHGPRVEALPPDCCFIYVPTSPQCSDIVHFQDCSVDPDGIVVAWDWDFGDGDTSTDQNPLHVFAVGSWTVCLTVTDDSGLQATCCRTVEAVDTIPPMLPCPADMTVTDDDCDGELVEWPTLDATDNCPLPKDDPQPDCTWVPTGGCAVGPDGVGYTEWAHWQGGVIDQVKWFTTPPSNPQDEPGEPGMPVEPGVNTVQWCYSDAAGNQAVCAQVVTVLCPPTCAVTWEPVGPMVGDPVQFHASASDPDGGPATCQWTFGDGTVTAGCDPVHIYTAPGVYDVCVTVTDDEGDSTECCERIAIGPGEELCFTLQGNCWHLITIPCYPINPDPWEVLDELRPPNQPLDLLSGNLHRYDNATQGYITYQRFNPGPFGPIAPGAGYWLWLFEPATLCYPTWCYGQPEELYFPSTGWYMMGSPKPYDTYIDDTRWYQGAAGPLPFSMIMNTWVQDPLIGYRCEPLPSGYFNVGLLPIDDDDHLRAFKGYWMYAFEPDLTMVVP